MPTVNLTVTPAGLHLNLTNRGFTYDNLHRPAIPGEAPTDTAARVLGEHGWKVTGDWQKTRTGGSCATWTALIDDNLTE